MRYPSSRFARALCGLAVCALTPAATWASEPNLCPDDRPCFNGARQNGNTVRFQFDGVVGWDYYNVRYRKDGGEKQVENRSGHYTFRNVLPRRVYTLSVQGCDRRALQSSRCSPWVSQSVTTR